MTTAPLRPAADPVDAGRRAGATAPPDLTAQPGAAAAHELADAIARAAAQGSAWDARASAGEVLALRSANTSSLSQTLVPLVQLLAGDLVVGLRTLDGLRAHELADPARAELAELVDSLLTDAAVTGVLLAANRRAVADLDLVAARYAAADLPLLHERLGRNESAYWTAISALRQAARALEAGYAEPGRRGSARRAVLGARIVAAQAFDQSAAAAALATSQPLTVESRQTIAALVRTLAAARRPDAVATAQRELGAELASYRPVLPAEREVTLTAPLEYGTEQYGALLDQIARRSAGREESVEGFHEQLDLLRAAGFGAFRVPRELGGSGGTLAEFLTIVSDIAERNPNLAHVLRTHGAFIEARLRSTRTDERERWLRAAADGVFFANLDGELTSGAVGAQHRAASSTEVVEVDGELRLRGRKFYSTGGAYVDRVSVSGVRGGTVTRAVVPTDREGVRPLLDWDGFGQVLTQSGTTVLDDVRILPEEIIVEGEDSGDTVRYFVLGQIYILAIQSGILRATVTDAQALLHRRTRTFSNAAAASPVEDPQLHRVLGDIAAQAFAAQALLETAARAMDEAMATLLERRVDPYLAREFALRIAKAKVFLDDAGPRAANALFDLGGASATRKLHNLDRHWRNIRTVSTHNPAATKARVLGEYLVTPGLEFPGLW